MCWVCVIGVFGVGVFEWVWCVCGVCVYVCGGVCVWWVCLWGVRMFVMCVFCVVNVR